MTLDNPKVGPSFLPAYQISGLPYVTSSLVTSGTVTQIDFPYVTSFIACKNTSDSGSLLVGFTRSGTLGNNRISLGYSGSFGGDFRIKSLFITANIGSVNFELLAGLTLIATKDFPTLSGTVGPVSQSISYSGIG